MYIRRELENKLHKYLNTKEIIAVIGPRQAGKTTLLKKVKSELNQAVYLSFEDQETLNLFNQNIKDFYLFYLKDKKYVFIDEFQYAKRGGKNLKYLYDTYNIKIIISGSSALDLTHQAIKFLVGRIFVFHLYPFNFSEFLRAKDKHLFVTFFSHWQQSIKETINANKKILPDINDEILNKLLVLYKEYVVYGGYPRVVLARDYEEKKEVLKNIFNIYFLREIRDILKLETDYELNQLIKLQALQVGGMVSYNELGQTIGLNYHKLLKHLKILEKTFITHNVLPFYTNKRTEITKTPKVYFYDPGFRNAALNNFQKYDERTDQGMLNENFTANALLNQECPLRYWRTKSNAEIDFVFQRDEKLYAFEVKTSLNRTKAGKSYYSFKEKYSPFRFVVLSTNLYSQEIKNSIMYLPIYFI